MDESYQKARYHNHKKYKLNIKQEYQEIPKLHKKHQKMRYLKCQLNKKC